jgi:uncharacterized protein YndB with AHSA1/START domain
VSHRSTIHSTFVIERSYPADPARVFGAWADAQAKGQWFGPSSPKQHRLDFSVGGTEHLAIQMESGDTYTYDARYLDIVAGERIVYSYDMHRNDDRISVSLATVELAPDPQGTRLTLTEQGVFLDGHDTPEQREHGTRELMDALGSALAGEAVRA